MGQAPRHQLGQHEPGLDRLAEPHAISQQQARPAHADGAQHGHELVGLQARAARLGGEERVRAERLFEQEGLVIDELVAKRCGAVGTQVEDQGLYRLERVKEVDLLAVDDAAQAAQAIDGLRPEALRVHTSQRRPRASTSLSRPAAGSQGSRHRRETHR